LQAALDVDLAALGDQLVAGLGQLVPGHDVEPLGLVALLVVRRGPAPADRDRERGDGRPVRRVAHLGVAADVADDHDLVQAPGHGYVPWGTSMQRRTSLASLRFRSSSRSACGTDRTLTCT